ncbi:MAG: cobalt-precorrin-6A reductase [Rhodospirillaceae bacterium]|jgi:precorrin-6A/cobalt-precorrin-6A reductase|nr:cobalt-precorrin-6A reductase [Rhodospirillaceae bacterium]MBT5667432.1 cobalt-precorrin-6A reductase [Rhodospirillaceae bacterium]
MQDRKPHLLILGGTGEAAALARAVATVYGDRILMTSSLAGRTRAPASIPGAIRIGGFGGPDGLRAWINVNGIDAVIDATHPFAARMSANVDQAVGGLPNLGGAHLRLVRPAWTPRPGDDWRTVEDVVAAAAILPSVGRRAFLTVGASDLGAFSGVADIYFLVRVIDIPDSAPPLAKYDIVTARGPFSKTGEIQLMKDHRIDVVVSKNSGGDATVAKLDAARAASLPVIMIARPPARISGDRAETTEQALAWLRRVVGPE